MSSSDARPAGPYLRHPLWASMAIRVGHVKRESFIAISPAFLFVLSGLRCSLTEQKPSRRLLSRGILAPLPLSLPVQSQSGLLSNLQKGCPVRSTPRHPALRFADFNLLTDLPHFYCIL